MKNYDSIKSIWLMIFMIFMIFLFYLFMIVTSHDDFPPHTYTHTEPYEIFFPGHFLLLKLLLPSQMSFMTTTKKVEIDFVYLKIYCAWKWENLDFRLPCFPLPICQNSNETRKKFKIFCNLILTSNLLDNKIEIFFVPAPVLLLSNKFEFLFLF